MRLSFTKMHGLGNDFMVVASLDKPFSLTKQRIQALSDRHTGVGFDQLLVIEPATMPDVDFNYRIFNADGGEVGQCGNGARAIARYIHDKGLSDKSSMVVRTFDDNMHLHLHDDGLVTVSLAVPQFTPAQIPLQVADQQALYQTAFDNQSIAFGAVNVGNPHAVIEVSDVSTAPVESWGSHLQASELFPEGVNVGFMEIVNDSHVRLRVLERGAGETQACGSGACAAVVVGQHWQKLQEKVSVDLPGGRLSVSWAGKDEPVSLTGPAVVVYEGELEVKE